MEVCVGDAADVTLDSPSASLMQGEKRKLRFSFETPDGPLDDVALDAEVVDPAMGRIGRQGWLTAGMQEGEAIIRVRYGSTPRDVKDFTLEIGPDRVPPPEGRGEYGGDVPEILFCGDEAPGTTDYPPERRIAPGGPKLPTIIEDPQFPNVV